MTGVLFLFTESYTAGTRDSEKFVNPDITGINFNIHGVPNRLFSKGMIPTDFWELAKKRFGHESIKEKEFYAGNKFALWVDLRTFPEHSEGREIHGEGLALNSVQDGIKMEIKRKIGGSGNITCHIFVVADACMEIINSNLRSILK